MIEKESQLIQVIVQPPKKRVFQLENDAHFLKLDPYNCNASSTNNTDVILEHNQNIEKEIEVKRTPRNSLKSSKSLERVSKISTKNESEKKEKNIIIHKSSSTSKMHKDKAHDFNEKHPELINSASPTQSPKHSNDKARGVKHSSTAGSIRSACEPRDESTTPESPTKTNLKPSIDSLGLSSISSLPALPAIPQSNLPLASVYMPRKVSSASSLVVAKSNDTNANEPKYEPTSPLRRPLSTSSVVPLLWTPSTPSSPLLPNNVSSPRTSPRLSRGSPKKGERNKKSVSPPPSPLVSPSASPATSPRKEKTTKHPLHKALPTSLSNSTPSGSRDHPREEPASEHLSSPRSLIQPLMRLHNSFSGSDRSTSASVKTTNETPPTTPIKSAVNNPLTNPHRLSPRNPHITIRHDIT